MESAKHNRFECDAGDAAEVEPPKPPASVLMAMGGGAGRGPSAIDDDHLPGLGGGDVWAALAKRYSVVEVGETKNYEVSDDEDGEKKGGRVDESDDDDDERNDDDDDDDDESDNDDDDEEDDDEEEDQVHGKVEEVDGSTEEGGVKRRRCEDEE